MYFSTGAGLSTVGLKQLGEVLENRLTMRSTNNTNRLVRHVSSVSGVDVESLAKKVGIIFVRAADDVRIAQRFIAGFGQAIDLSPRSGRLKAESESVGSVISRPFHGLIHKCRLEPSTKVLGYSHLVCSADDINSDFSTLSAGPSRYEINSSGFASASSRRAKYLPTSDPSTKEWWTSIEKGNRARSCS
jgi:hypothetical protein